VSGSGSFTIEDEGDSRSIIGRDFALVFHPLGDRWTHSVEAARTAGGPRETIATATEWDAERDDPTRVVSPVFQEIQFHEAGSGRPQALLLGMSGRHHFSAAFVVEEKEGGVTLSVDVADRCREAGSTLLASTYTALLHSGELSECDESRIAWDLGGRRLTLAAGPSTRVGLAEAGRRATRVQALADIGVAGPTRRWQYSWCLSL
jgi:hypothetical protein